MANPCIPFDSKEPGKECNNTDKELYRNEVATASDNQLK
jgi:hypothetical protein